MSYCEDSNINKSYIVQNVESSDIFSACTEIYLTNIIPCTGDTININSNLNVTGDISGTTFYGDGSQLSGIITTDNYVTGGVYTASTKSLYFTGTTGFTPFSIDVSALLDDTNNYVTGGTYSSGTLTLDRNDGDTVTVTGFSQTFTGNTSGTCIGDIYVSNIHSCSPLRINSNDEGNAYFGSTSGITIDILNQRVGIGTNSPTEALVVSGNTIVGGTLTIGNIPNGKPVSNLGFDSGGTVVIGTTGDTDTNTFVTGGTLSGNDLILEKNNNVDVNPIDLSGLVSGKVETTLFNTYTGDTETVLNSKLDTTSFNTYSGSVETQLNSKTDNTDFVSHTGDTTIHFTKSSINLSDLGNTAHTHTLSEITDFNPYSGSVQTQIDNKTDLTLFNSHTGDTNNPHQTSFANLTSTAHTHSISDVINLQTELDSNLDVSTFNSYSGNVETELNTKISGATNLSSEGIFAQKNGLDLEFKGLTSTGGTVNISSDSTSVNLEVTAVGSDKFVSGGTYNGGTKKINFVGNSVDTTFDVNLTSLVSSVSGDTFSTGGTVTQSATSGSSEVTIQIVGNDGFSSYDITGLTDTFVNDFTFSSNTFTITQNDGTSFDADVDTIDLASVLSAVTFDIGTSGSISATTFNGTTFSGGTFYGDGSNLTGISNTFVTGGTFNDNTDTITFTNNTGGTFNVTGVTDNFVSGGTYNGGTKEINFTGNSVDTTFSVDLTSLVNTVTGDTFVTGFTWNPTTFDLTIEQNNGITDETVNLSVLATDVYVVSGIYNPATGIVTYTNSTGGTFQVTGFTTGMTDSYTTAANLNGETIEFDNNIQGSNLYNVSLSPVLSGKTDLTLFNTHTGDTTIHYTKSSINLSDLGNTAHTHTLSEITDFNSYSGDVQTQIDGKVETTAFNSHTGDTNNPHQTSFSDLTSTAHTHTVSDVINLQTELDSKTNNTDFISHTGDTTIHFTKGDINLSDLGSTAHTHSISEVINLQTELDNKTDLSLFNTHTGDTNNPHQTSFSNLSSTAHTHTLSEITDFNSYSGDVQTQLDTKIENGINSGGANEVFSGKSGTDLYFRTISGGSNTTITTIDDIIKVDVSVPVDTNTFVTGGTYSSGTLTLDRNDNNSVVVTGFTTGGGGDNFYVTGFTYNDANTFTISRNGGLGDLSATINTLTGLTVNGVLSATTYTGITLDGIDDVTTNIPASPDNTYQGELMYFDVASNQWVSNSEYGNLGDVTIWGKKGSAGTIDKGCPVYITGFDNDIHEVELANATTATTMPVIGFTAEDFDNAGVYPIITFGKISGLDTTSGSTILNPFAETWEVNDVLYMAKSDGGLTKFRPSGTNTQIQRIAKVLKVDTTSGQLFIFNTARTAGLPNLTTDYLWLGNGDDTPQEVVRTDVGITTTGFTYNDNNTFTITDDNGGSLSATINQVSGLTINGDLDVTGDTTLNTLTATSITSNSAIDVFNGHINLRDNSYFLQGRTVADVNVSLIGVDSQDRVFVGNAGYDTYIDSDTIVDGVLSAQTAFLTTTPTLNNSGTDILLRNSTTGEIEYRPVSGITPDTNTFVTGGTLSGDNLILEKNNGVNVNSIDLSGLVSGKTDNTNFVTHTGNTTIHFTKGDINLSDLGVSAHTHPISEVINLQTELDSKIETASNVGGAIEVFSGKSGTDLKFRTISGGTNTNVAISGDTIVINSTGGGSGEVNTASNLGGGTGLFAQKNGVDLEFKSLTSTGGTVTITNNSTTVNIESTGGDTGVSDANKIFSWFMNVT
jgi:hypothetical protein